ncbi:MAG TPA: methyl-accepting chemotaxis protein [Rhizomicrobium sp.]|jgi:methyl-accepting chemotaxis protein|nr:methyl-accepting chemotaxis protein [Rhizomicrobium sp.]
MNSTNNFDRESRLRFANITERTGEVLRELWKNIQQDLPRILDGFYAKVSAEPSVGQLVGSRSSQLKQAQTSHWARLFSGTFDNTYMESVYRIGLTHKRIGLEPRWYLAGYQHILTDLVGVAVRAHRWSPAKMQEAISAVNAAVLFDIDLATSAYQDAIEQEKQEAAKAIANGVKVVGKGLAELARGDLSVRISDTLEGEFSAIGNNFNSAVDELQKSMMTTVASFQAIGRSQAVIEFNLDGTIITANENFLSTMGYGASDIAGKHHSMFIDPEYARSVEYRQFWDRLNRGEFISDKFKRLGRGGREIWIQASYNPLFDAAGKPFKVIKFATDITAAENENNELKSKFVAISRSQAVIEFDLHGKILSANKNFLDVMGYSASDIAGAHHSMFVDPEYAKSADYRLFWDRLGQGEFMSDKFRRFARGGKEIWIQASYNPLFDLNGKPFKVVKFATDITQIEADRKAAEQERAAKAAQQAQVVSSLATGLKNLSGGNLVSRIDDTFAEDYEQLRADFNAAVDRLHDTMKSVTSATSGIATGADEISQATDDLSKRTEQQAASLEETAAALEEITATVKKTAQNAKEASAIVTTAKTAAENGGQVVDTAIKAMGQIEQSSKQITDIIGVIDEIAFQTNLLALNAGVEAARAGDAGKGFAVVASEVRALAQRSSEAAREIKTLIKASGEHVTSGVKLVGESGEALNRIVSQVAEINTLVSEMAMAAQQQSTGIEEVNTAVTQMDQVTQQNAAMVEESTAAARSLATETTELSELVAFFKVEGGSSATRAPARVSSARPAAKMQQRPRAIRGGVALATKVVAAEDEWQEF